MHWYVRSRVISLLVHIVRFENTTQIILDGYRIQKLTKSTQRKYMAKYWASHSNSVWTPDSHITYVWSFRYFLHITHE